MKMNPFKGRKSKIEEKFEAACAADKERLEALISKAEAETDPASKVLKLKQVQGNISGFLAKREASVSEQAKREGHRAGAKGGAYTFLGGIALMCAPHLFLIGAGACLFMPEITSKLLNHSRSAHVQEKLEKIAASHLGYLTALGDDLAGKIEDVMSAHVPEIEKSLLQPRIMQDESLANSFEHAAAKYQAAQDAAAQKATPPVKKMVRSDYKKLSDALAPKKSPKPDAS